MSKQSASGESTTRAVLAWLVGCIAITMAGCKHDDTDARRGCTPAATNTCLSATGCTGVQVCQPDGTWNPCDCGAASEGPLLGGGCTTNAECPAGALCLTPESTAWMSGGPPSGICVADCTANPKACAAFRNGICVSAARDGSTKKQALCLPTCDLTQGTNESFSCASVPHSVCEPLDVGHSGFCRPFCRFDSQCASGYCDRQVGACVATAPPAHAQAFGEGCAPGASDCDGVCRSVSNDLALCSYRCVFGSSDECAVEGANPIVGVCAYTESDIAPGNVGYCAPLCDCNDDCVAPGYACRAFTNENTRLAYGKVGICVPLSAMADLAGVACAAEGS